MPSEVESLLIIVGLSGLIHYGLVHIAFWLAQDVSPASVTAQRWVPFTALSAYCPDIVDQGTDNLATLAAILMVSDWWFFWWD